MSRPVRDAAAFARAILSSRQASVRAALWKELACSGDRECLACPARSSVAEAFPVVQDVERVVLLARVVAQKKHSSGLAERAPVQPERMKAADEDAVWIRQAQARQAAVPASLRREEDGSLLPAATDAVQEKHSTGQEP